MTLEQAHKQGINARALTLPMSQIARAIEWGEALPSLARLLLGDDLPGCPNM
jgi:dihydrolipoamide dehydrogenase